MVRFDASTRSAPGMVLLVWALLAALWWSGLDERPLARPDEGRYAEISREMALGSDWITPRLNGIQYFEKPPLQYWATALAYRGFGVGERTARLWTVGCGFLSLVLTAWLAGAAGAAPGAALLAPLVLAGALYAGLLGHINTLDSGVSAFLTATLACYLQSRRSPASRRWMLAAGACAGLAMLSKGLIAVALPGVALLLYTFINRDLSGWRRLHPLAATGTLLLVAGPWFLACSLRNPGFAEFFFVHEHFQRFTSTIHQRVEPVWYFLPLLLVGLLPWTLVLPRALLQAWASPATPPAGFRPLRFVLAYGIGVVAFFSLSGSKLPGYILPAFPAFAVLIAHSLASAPRLPRLALGTGSLLQALLLLLAAALFGLPELDARLGIRLDLDPDMVAPYARLAPWLAVGAAALAAGSLLLRLLPDRQRHAACVALGLAGLVASSASLHGAAALAPFNSSASWVAQWRDAVPSGSRLFSVGTYDQTLDFYLERTVTLVDFQDELAFGLEREPGLAIADPAAFRATWGRQPDDHAVMEPERYRQLLEQGLPMRVVARDSRHVVVSPR
ncbi:MAG: glycosyltransferase family 39 protein [Pseudomonadota bacterium]|nr:glycosyltransferase family 39 protein [Pseudomonadota bacterium]